ncbi:SDR family oxidoreductase [Amycolatopsis keratiniphila]|uniref:3-beta hydroxysteroid dehydrogenase n=1 Tax=Amycolatopsis keratiniphila subsp. keratiniphila TaxID=227715 RepID=A0A1W2LNU8_9PSEU|nr:SDR family oxidoreductase [Amycolatopsis keratiniphila]ONF65011.1 3-beta hydroxysteroid dehydrogenase [Amycolatopsis keratiniphila subsp. keratiniphila]
MHVFVTGATGWIGSAVVDELLDAGHEVTGLARSDASAAALERKGARVRRGDLDDLDGLRAGAEAADAVIHLANKHDWANPAESDRAERAAVQTFADALTGTGRAFVLAAGLSTLATGRPATETDLSPAVGPGSHRGGAENLALEYAGKGMRVISARFAPSVHGVGDHGFVAALVAAARKHGVSGYLGDGSAAWAAVHRTDAARLVRLGLEGAPTGSLLHAVAEEAVTTKEIAGAIGRTLDVPVMSVAPENAAEHFGFVGRFFALDMSASSDRTRELLKWTPYGPSLAEDIEAGAYA